MQRQLPLTSHRIAAQLLEQRTFVWEIRNKSRSRAGAVMRALAFHQCGPGSIPGFYAICGLSLLVLYSAPRGFSPGTPVFPSSQKPTFAGVAQLASARLSEQGVPSSILGDFNVCFHFPLTRIAIALNIRETEH